MDSELLFKLITQNLLEIGQIRRKVEPVHMSGRKAEHIMENMKTIRNTVKVFIFLTMVGPTSEAGLRVNNMA